MSQRKEHIVTDEDFKGTACIHTAPGYFSIDKATEHCPTATQHVFVKSDAFREDSMGCTCWKFQRQAHWLDHHDNTELSTELRPFYDTGTLTDLTLDHRGEGLGCLRTFMACKLLEFTKQYPTLFIVTEPFASRPQRFVYRCEDLSVAEAHSKVEGESDGRNCSGDSANDRPGSDLPGSSSPVPSGSAHTTTVQGSQLFLGSLDKAEHFNFGTVHSDLVLIGEMVRDRRTGYTENHITIVDLLQSAYNGDAPKGHKIMRLDTEPKIKKVVREVISDEKYMSSHRRRLSEAEVRKAGARVDAQLHFISKEDFAKSVEGQAVTRLLRQKKDLGDAGRHFYI